MCVWDIQTDYLLFEKKDLCFGIKALSTTNKINELKPKLIKRQQKTNIFSSQIN